MLLICGAEIGFANTNAATDAHLAAAPKTPILKKPTFVARRIFP
jgi:hypothetical protein